MFKSRCPDLSRVSSSAPNKQSLEGNDRLGIDTLSYVRACTCLYIRHRYTVQQRYLAGVSWRTCEPLFYPERNWVAHIRAQNGLSKERQREREREVTVYDYYQVYTHETETFARVSQRWFIDTRTIAICISLDGRSDRSAPSNRFAKWNGTQVYAWPYKSTDYWRIFRIFGTENYSKLQLWLLRAIVFWRDEKGFLYVYRCVANKLKYCHRNMIRCLISSERCESLLI